MSDQGFGGILGAGREAAAPAAASSGPLPFAFDPATPVDANDVPREAMLPASETQVIWTKIFTALGIVAAADKNTLVKSFLMYLAANGSSPRNVGERKICSGTYRVRDIFDVIDSERLRRFARAHADQTRAVLRTEPEFALSLARRMGLRIDYQSLAFDYSDFCSGLSREERLALRDVKMHTLGTTDSYSQNTAELNDNVQGIAPLPAPSPYRSMGRPQM